jgi:hypothetical protein
MTTIYASDDWMNWYEQLRVNGWLDETLWDDVEVLKHELTFPRQGAASWLTRALTSRVEELSSPEDAPL